MRKLYFSLFILGLAVAGSAQASENLQFLRQMSDGFAELAAQVKPGVVKITTEGTEEGSVLSLPWGRPFRVPDQQRRGQGSGVVAEFDGQQYIITNNHVIRHADDIRVEGTDSRFFAGRGGGSRFVERCRRAEDQCRRPTHLDNGRLRSTARGRVGDGHRPPLGFGLLRDYRHGQCVGAGAFRA